jgi:hypothetical protein
MRSERVADAIPWEGTPVNPAADPIGALQMQCKRLQLLVGELLVKNQELRFEMARAKSQDMVTTSRVGAHKILPIDQV